MEWQFENTGHRTGVFNMEYDETLAQKLVRMESTDNFSWLESING
jgi:hypothetical protein